MMSLRIVVMAFVAATCVSAAPRATVHYFDIRGLAQAIRLMLSDLEIEFDEVRHTGDTWPAAKKAGIESGFLTFGQLPALEYWDANGKATTLVQSVAIMNFLGREHGVTGTTNKELAKIDVLIGGTGDLRKRYGAFSYNKDTPTDPSLLENYKKDIATWMPFFEKAVEGKYVLGEKFTIADVMLFDLLDTCVLRPDPRALAEYPKLAALHKTVAARPGIARYLASDKCHPFANGASAFFDTEKFPLAQQEEL